MFSKKINRRFYLIFLSIFLSVDVLSAEDAIKALIVTGQNNHKWEASSVILQRYLNGSGIFVADMAVSPKSGEDMSSFCPDFSQYGVVVLDYNGDAWTDDVKRAFEEYVKNGGGVVVYHAANNAFRNWREYNEIIGLGGWGDRDETDGDYVYFLDGKEVRDSSPGLAGSHGRPHEYKIKLVVNDHPVTEGLPNVWTHSKDELYDRLRGPAKNLTVLATAYSDRETGGTGRDEPVLMTIIWGKGRIFHTVLGDAAGEPPYPAIEGASFITTFLRGAEWAATGRVTQKVADNFPAK
jgi:type 1 glutamine amidotransferase